MPTDPTSPETASAPTERFRIAAGSREVWWFGGRVDVKLTGPETGGRMGMWLWQAERGDTAPWHVHPDADEQFLLIEGEARFRIGDETLDARAGDLVLLPRGVPHAYLITSPQARVVGTIAPGGFEGFFTELGTPVASAETAPAPPAPQAMAEAGRRYGVEVLGPPPALG